MSIEQQQVWLATYTAAITGFLAGGKPISKSRLKDGCCALADQAVVDFDARWKPQQPPFKGGKGV